MTGQGKTDGEWDLQKQKMKVEICEKVRNPVTNADNSHQGKNHGRTDEGPADRNERIYRSGYYGFPVGID